MSPASREETAASLGKTYSPVYALYKERARNCLLWNMSPDYYDRMSVMEHAAWIAAWNQLQREQEEASKRN